MQINRTGIIGVYILLLLFGLGFFVRYSGITNLGMQRTESELAKIMKQSGDNQELYEDALRRLGDNPSQLKQREILASLQNIKAFRAVKQMAGHLLSLPDAMKDVGTRCMLLSVRGTSSLDTGDLKGGLEDLEAAWKLMPSAPSDIQNNLAYALVLNKVDLDRAEDLAAQAYNKDNNAATADTLGWININQGNIHNGLQLLLEATDGNSDSYESRYHVGVAYWASGDFAKAEAELTVAIKLYKAQRQVANPGYEAVLDRVRAKTPFTVEAIP